MALRRISRRRNGPPDAHHPAGLGVQAVATTTGTCMTASTLSGNRPARAALRRLGFRTVGIDDNSVELALTLARHA